MHQGQRLIALRTRLPLIMQGVFWLLFFFPVMGLPQLVFPKDSFIYAFSVWADTRSLWICIPGLHVLLGASAVRMDCFVHIISNFHSGQ